MTLPSKPTGDYALKTTIYAQDSQVFPMSDSELAQGRNHTGEVETALGSVPNVHKLDYLLRYICTQIDYLNKTVDYIITRQNIT